MRPGCQLVDHGSELSDLPGTMPLIELTHALDGLDAHPWSASSHAYGGAEDLPDLLRVLAGADMDAAEREGDPMGAIEALEALGADALSPGHLRRLAALAEGDVRVIRSGVEGRIIRQDEAFRDRSRALLAVFAHRTASMTGKTLNR
jgi:hypothetical protein